MTKSVVLNAARAFELKRRGLSQLTGAELRELAEIDPVYWQEIVEMAERAVAGEQVYLPASAAISRAEWDIL